MVGRLRNARAIVYGTGSARELPTVLHRVALATGLRFSTQSEGIGPSDHTSFFVAQRPVLHFFTGAHDDYHRPSDTADKLNAQGMARIAEAVLDTVQILAASAEPPTFVATTESPRMAGGGYGAYLGTVPDFARSSGGVRIAAVRDASPAAAAGLANGDVIVGIGGVAINDLYDLTYALRSHVAGDRVTIEYLRAGRRRSTDATLGTR
jgi:C-terminal processing protease CtpA/Prc